MHLAFTDHQINYFKASWLQLKSDMKYCRYIGKKSKNLPERLPGMCGLNFMKTCMRSQVSSVFPPLCIKNCLCFQ